MNAYSAVEPVHFNDHPVPIEATVLFTDRCRAKLKTKKVYSYELPHFRRLFLKACSPQWLFLILHNLAKSPPQVIGGDCGVRRQTHPCHQRRRRFVRRGSLSRFHYHLQQMNQQRDGFWWSPRILRVAS
jgi:hypothetical protein